MTKIGSKLILWLNAFLPPVLWAGLIFFFSSQEYLPGLSFSGLDFFFKKLAHIFVYAVLYFLLVRGTDLVLTSKADLRFRILLPIGLLVLYAISDELHQSLVPNRYATLRDAQ
jgi:hypothetical protein